MERVHPRELELARVEVGILNECVGHEDTELAFLELHARTLLTHIVNARRASNKPAEGWDYRSPSHRP